MNNYMVLIKSYLEPQKLLLLVLLVLFSCLTVNKYSPEFLHADVIINSVMSLQNITLFYWGQNRLSNVLPLLANIFRDPEVNLYFVLFFTAFIHYLLFFVFAKIGVAIAIKKKGRFTELTVFSIISLALLVVFNDRAIFSITLAHIEYSLSALMIIIVFWSGINNTPRFKFWLCFSAFFIFVAIGVNYSVIILCAALVATFIFYTRMLTKNVTLFSIISIVSFILWNVLSKKYGASHDYSTFNFEQISSGVVRSLTSLASVVNILAALLILFFIATFNFLISMINKEKEMVYSRVIFFSYSILILFSLSWFLLFSASEWVMMNKFNYRYFTFSIYGLFIVLSIQFSDFLNFTNKFANSLVALVSIIITVVFLSSPYVKLADYHVFKKVDALVPTAHGLYSGNYWTVWPTVLRDMMSGNPSFGLADRGIGNQEKASVFVNKQILDKGYFSVLCLNDKLASCKDMISNIVGPVAIERVIPHTDSVKELILLKSATALYSNDELFASLPSNTGSLVGLSRITNNKAGLLFYGPYAPVTKGIYTLTVYGHAERASGAFVDVTSKLGGVIHAKFLLKPSVETGVLVTERVEIPSNISDLEIRLHVSEKDKLVVTGYDLLPADNL